ncbi:MAG: hypothetical protein R3B06_08670 [Kofleriaceae bacterium]
MTASVRAVALAQAARRLGAVTALGRLDDRDAATAGVLAASAEALPTAALAAARPAGWRHCDRSWIDAALAPLDPTARAIVDSDRDDPVARWLAARTLGHLAPMPTPGPAITVDDLPRLSARALARVLVIVGRRQLAAALAQATVAEHAAAARQLAWGVEFLREVAEVRADPAAVASLGGRRAAAARTAGLAWTDPLAAAQAGARALASTVRGRGDLARQVAQRLPRPLGTAVAEALTGRFARDGAPLAAAEIRRAIERGSVAP